MKKVKQLIQSDYNYTAVVVNMCLYLPEVILLLYTVILDVTDSLNCVLVFIFLVGGVELERMAFVQKSYGFYSRHCDSGIWHKSLAVTARVPYYSRPPTPGRYCNINRIQKFFMIQHNKTQVVWKNLMNKNITQIQKLKPRDKSIPLNSKTSWIKSANSI